jgi:hypothetical protein
VADIAIGARLVPHASLKLLEFFHKLGLDKDLHLLVAMARDHRKLDAFKLADQMAIAVYLATADFPIGNIRTAQSGSPRRGFNTDEHCRGLCP